MRTRVDPSHMERDGYPLGAQLILFKQVVHLLHRRGVRVYVVETVEHVLLALLRRAERELVALLEERKAALANLGAVDLRWGGGSCELPVAREDGRAWRDRGEVDVEPCRR